MLLQFKTEDDSIFIADVQYLQWGRVSAPPNPANPQESVVLEQGKLVPMGFGVYNLEGRTPKTGYNAEGKPEGPGAGLSSIGTFVVGLGTTVKVFVKANVTIKDFTMPVPISQVLYEVLPANPQQTEDSIAALGTPKPEVATEPIAPLSTIPESAFDAIGEINKAVEQITGANDAA